MGRVETLFGLARGHAALKFPWIGSIKVKLCGQADADHRKSWRQFAHTGHDPYVVCFARAAERELTDEEILGMSAHEIGHVVGARLRYPEHTKRGSGKRTPQRVQDEADRIAREVLGFTGLRYNRRSLQELRTASSVTENPDPFIIALKALPRCIGGFDQLQHKSVSDLVWLARHELDLHEEGEETSIRTTKQIQAVREYIRRFGSSEMRALL